MNLKGFLSDAANQVTENLNIRDLDPIAFGNSNERLIGTAAPLMTTVETLSDSLS